MDFFAKSVPSQSVWDLVCRGRGLHRLLRQNLIHVPIKFLTKVKKTPGLLPARSSQNKKKLHQCIAGFFIQFFFEKKKRNLGKIKDAESCTNLWVSEISNIFIPTATIYGVKQRKVPKTAFIPNFLYLYRFSQLPCVLRLLSDNNGHISRHVWIRRPHVE